MNVNQYWSHGYVICLSYSCMTLCHGLHENAMQYNPELVYLLPNIYVGGVSTWWHQQLCCIRGQYRSLVFQGYCKYREYKKIKERKLKEKEYTSYKFREDNIFFIDSLAWRTREVQSVVSCPPCGGGPGTTSSGANWCQALHHLVPILASSGANIGIIWCQSWHHLVLILAPSGAKLGIIWCQDWP